MTTSSVSAGQTVAGTSLTGGDFEYVLAGGTTSGTMVNAGATQVVSSGGLDIGTLVNSGGTVAVLSGGAIDGATLNGGTLDIGRGGMAGGGTVTFAGGGVLKLDDSSSFSGQVSGFGIPGAIDLADIAYGSDTTFSFSEAASHTSGTLTVSDGGWTASLTLLGQYVTGNFAIAGDGEGGTLVTDPPAAVTAPPTTAASGHTFAIQGISFIPGGANELEAYAQSGGQAGYPTFLAQLQEAVADGANFVALGNVESINPATGATSDYVPGGVDDTASFSTLGPAIQAAQADGLGVMLKPQFTATSGNLWDTTTPGLISDPAAFFAGYETYILQWAQLAQQYNVPILCIGTEMGAASGPQYTTYWDNIIAAIRQVYSGKLTYSAEFTPYYVPPDGEVGQIGFWNELDYVGVEIYPSLSTVENPTVAQLDTGWTTPTIAGQTANYVSAITQIAASTGKPILFTEDGVASVQYPGIPGYYASSDSANASSADQANWWQSFYDTWAANPPSWLAGLFAWDIEPEEVVNNNASYAASYQFFGKPAESVIAAMYGGVDYLPWNADSITGSGDNDHIYLYGAAGGGAQATSQRATYDTVITFHIAGTIINGQTQTVQFIVNGVNEGQQTLSPVPGTADGNGVLWTEVNPNLGGVGQAYTVTLPGLVAINQLEVAIVGPLNLGGVENSSIHIGALSITGEAPGTGVALNPGVSLSLTSTTYTPLNGSAMSFNLTDHDLNEGGTVVVDASAWNSTLSGLQVGTAASPIQVNGGGGSDTVDVLGAPSEYTITSSGPGVVTLAEHSGLDQNAVLSGIAYIDFADGMGYDVASASYFTIPIYVSSGGSQNVNSGSPIVGTTVSSGGTQYVNSGGVASGTAISAGGSGFVFSGGQAVSAVVSSGGQQQVWAGGSASGTLIQPGGSEYVYGSETMPQISAGGAQYISGGDVSGATVAGDQFVFGAGGAAVSAVVSSGGIQDTYSGGAASGTRLSAGGWQIVWGGGAATAVVVSSGGYDDVYSGGVASGAVVSSGGWQFDWGSGSAVSTTVAAGGGIQDVYSGGVASGTTVSSGSWQFALLGGEVGGTTVSSGGWQLLYSGGTAGGGTIMGGGYGDAFSGGAASGATIMGGGWLYAWGGGSASGIVVSSGGYEFVYSGGTASGAVVQSGGWEELWTGGQATGTAVSSGGIEFVYSGAVASGTVVSSGGTGDVYGSAAGPILRGGYVAVLAGGVVSGATISAGTLAVASGGAASGTIGFAGGGSLDLAQATTFAATISGLTASNLIDLQNVAYGSGTTVGYANSGTSGTLTVSDGTHIAHLALLGQYVAGNFTLVSDGFGGTLVVDPPVVGQGTLANPLPT